MIQKQIAGFVDALIDVPIVIARTNYQDLDFTQDLAVIDVLQTTPVSRSQEFDGELEEMTYIVYNSTQATIDFYGDNALDNANKLVALLDSQTAYEYQRDNGIEVYHNKTLTNLKNIQGVTVYERYQLEIVVKYNKTLTEAVRRIDTAQTDVIFNR